jgi:hypothetical protein
MSIRSLTPHTWFSGAAVNLTHGDRCINQCTRSLIQARNEAWGTRRPGVLSEEGCGAGGELIQDKGNQVLIKLRALLSAGSFSYLPQPLCSPCHSDNKWLALLQCVTTSVPCSLSSIFAMDCRHLFFFLTRLHFIQASGAHSHTHTCTSIRVDG